MYDYQLSIKVSGGIDENVISILAVQTQKFGICPVEIPGQMGFSGTS
jgi:hypothetical protein